jgi:hypothetical protein
MPDELLTEREPTLREIKTALERLMEQARQRRHRYNTHQRPRTAATIAKSQEIAEMVALWRAVLDIVFPDKRTRGLIGWIAKQHGLSRAQLYKLLKKVDPSVATELRARAEAFAKEWAGARRESLNTIGETTPL